MSGLRWGLVVLAAGALGLVAWARSGLLNLPSVPAGLGLNETGLADLPAMKRLDEYVRGGGSGEGARPTPAARRMREGVTLARSGHAVRGLEVMRGAVTAEARDLVLGNAYRMVVFELVREALGRARRMGELGVRLPAHLEREPIAFFERLAEAQASRETRFQLALAWVDQVLLYPALEIKAPASVEAVRILTDLLEDDGGYVPALYARGLNHLHRPARLVWPETERTPLDAAARDLALCVAIGREFDVGSARLRGRLAMTLGDAYVKAGRLSLAQSWWQIAGNVEHGGEIYEAVRRRLSWREEETLDRLEEELDRCRAELDRPMTDLAVMWD